MPAPLRVRSAEAALFIILRHRQRCCAALRRRDGGQASVIFPITHLNSVNLKPLNALCARHNVRSNRSDRDIAATDQDGFTQHNAALPWNNEIGLTRSFAARPLLLRNAHDAAQCSTPPLTS